MSKTRKDNRLKIVFLGTSEFATPILRNLLDNRFEIAAVVTKPDRPAGRKKILKPTPVREFLKDNASDIDLIQAGRLKDEEFQSNLRAMNPDLFVVASFPILPMNVVRIPRLGCLNIHPSLLPRYRGAAPIRWAIMNNERVTGVSTFFIGGKVDAGNIFLQRKLEIGENENYSSLHDRLAELGAELAVESVKRLMSGDVVTITQNEAEATPAPKIKPEDSIIDWQKSAEEVVCKIRAFSYEPGAYTRFLDKRLKIFSAVTAEGHDISPGEARIEKDRLTAGCGDGCISLLEVQIEGKRMMDVKTFLRGARLAEGIISMA